MQDATERIDSKKTWEVRWTVKKYFDKDESEIDETTVPDEVIQIVDNLLLNAGINFLLNILIGGSAVTYPPWSNANANLTVGDSSTAAAATQTDMQAATNLATAGMDATFPSVTNQTVSFKATFGSGVANFAWNEVGAKNGAGAISSTIKMLNRKVASFGTKVAGSTWTMQLDITIA